MVMPETGLGSFLKAVRHDRGFTLDALSRRSGYSAGYICNIEAGRRIPNPFALSCILESMTLDANDRYKAALLLLEKEPKCS